MISMISIINCNYDVPDGEGGCARGRGPWPAMRPQDAMHDQATDVPAFVVVDAVYNGAVHAWVARVDESSCGPGARHKQMQ